MQQQHLILHCRAMIVQVLCSKYLHCVSQVSNWVHQTVWSTLSRLYYFIIFQIMNLFDLLLKSHKQITLTYDASIFLTDFYEGTVLRSTKGMNQYFWGLRPVTYNSRGVMILSFVFYSICPSLFLKTCFSFVVSLKKSLYFVLFFFQTSSYFLLFLFLLLFFFSSVA